MDRKRVHRRRTRLGRLAGGVSKLDDRRTEDVPPSGATEIVGNGGRATGLLSRRPPQLEQLLALAAERASNVGSRIHGVDHWRRVAENGAALAAETPGADAEVVAAFAALHDSQRLSDGRDPQHGERAAHLARTGCSEMSRPESFTTGHEETWCDELSVTSVRRRFGTSGRTCPHLAPRPRGAFGRSTIGRSRDGRRRLSVTRPPHCPSRN